MQGRSGPPRARELGSVSGDAIAHDRLPVVLLGSHRRIVGIGARGVALGGEDRLVLGVAGKLCLDDASDVEVLPLNAIVWHAPTLPFGRLLRYRLAGTRTTSWPLPMG